MRHQTYVYYIYKYIRTPGIKLFLITLTLKKKKKSAPSAQEVTFRVNSDCSAEEKVSIQNKPINHFICFQQFIA